MFPKERGHAAHGSSSPSCRSPAWTVARRPTRGHLSALHGTSRIASRSSRAGIGLAYQPPCAPPPAARPIGARTDWAFRKTAIRARWLKNGSTRRLSGRQPGGKAQGPRRLPAVTSSRGPLRRFVRSREFPRDARRTTATRPQAAQPLNLKPARNGCPNLFHEKRVEDAAAWKASSIRKVVPARLAPTCGASAFERAYVVRGPRGPWRPAKSLKGAPSLYNGAA